MNEERLRDGVEHLQNAALEMIEAARAFLDVAEDLVKDPAAVALVLSLLTPPHARRPRESDEHETRVQRIRVV